MEWVQKSKKGNPQDDFQKLLERPCPLHPKGKHTILECINLRKSLHQRQLEEDKKKKDKQDDCWRLPTSPLETSDGSADVNGVAGNSWATNKSASAQSTAVAFYPLFR